jgi:hypothetical protein
LRRGAKTIIAVGNDSTLNKALNALANTGVPLGIIPVGEKNNDIANALGIKSPDIACEVLSARRTEVLDLGFVSNNNFVSSVKINFEKILININGTYSIDVNKPGAVYLINMLTRGIDLPTNCDAQPFDGILQLYIRLGSSKRSIFKSKNSNSFFNLKNAELFKDGISSRVGINEKAIKLIVGKNRLF